MIALDKELSKRGKKAILWDYNKSFFSLAAAGRPGGVVFGRNAQGDLDPRRWA